MPQSSAAIRHKAEALRLLRHPDARAATPASQGNTPQRPVWARKPFVCHHGTCLALEVRGAAVWVKVRDAQGEEAWAPASRVLAPEQRRAWARTGF